MRQKIKCISALVCAVLLAVLLPATSYASQADDSSGNELTVEYAQSGVRFDLYRAAQLGSGGQWVLTGVFAGYPVALPGSGWLDSAATLAGLAAADQLPPDASATTENGFAVFSNLEPGMYLVVGQPSEAGGFRYTPVPFMVWVSGSVTAIVKYDREELPVEHVSYTVEKVWADDAGHDRPAQVTVLLLCDGAVYGTAQLSDANNWTYTWEHLESNHRWQVAEADVPDGYTFSVSQSGTVFTVTNTYQNPAPPTTEPEPPATTEPPEGGDHPATGDGTHYALIAGTAVVAAIALAALRRRAADYS